MDLTSLPGAAAPTVNPIPREFVMLPRGATADDIDFSSSYSLFFEGEYEDGEHDFIERKRTRVLPKIDSRYNHPAFSRSIGS